MFLAMWYSASAPEPPLDQKRLEQDIPYILEHSAQTQPLTSGEMYELRRRYPESVVLPSDVAQAAEIVGECESLWNELRKISNEPGFRQDGFAPHTRLGDWKRRADALNARPRSKEIVGSDVSGLPGKLVAVGIDYATNPLFGKKTSVMEDWFVNYHLPMAKKAIDGTQ